jgi:hypothetical protein
LQLPENPPSSNELTSIDHIEAIARRMETRFGLEYEEFDGHVGSIAAMKDIDIKSKITLKVKIDTSIKLVAKQKKIDTLGVNLSQLNGETADRSGVVLAV